MGLLSALFGRRDQAVASGWYPDGTGVLETEDGYSVRFLNDEYQYAIGTEYAIGTAAVVDVTVYAYHNQHEGPSVGADVHYIACSNREAPTETELWSDSRFGDLAVGLGSEAGARHHAEDVATALNAGTALFPVTFYDGDRDVLGDFDFDGTHGEPFDVEAV